MRINQLTCSAGADFSLFVMTNFDRPAMIRVHTNRCWPGRGLDRDVAWGSRPLSPTPHPQGAFDAGSAVKKGFEKSAVWRHVGTAERWPSPGCTSVG